MISETANMREGVRMQCFKNMFELEVNKLKQPCIAR